MTTTSTTVYGASPLNLTKDEILNAVEADDIFGVRYPLYDKTDSSKGIFVKTKGLELLKSQLRQFVRTERGERVMLPNFGLSLKRFLFEPLTDDLVLAIKKEVVNGLATYVPEARILNLRVVGGERIQGFGLPGIKIKLLVTSTRTDQQTDLTISL